MSEKQKTTKTATEKEESKKISPEEFDAVMKKILSAPPQTKKKGLQDKDHKEH